MADGMTPPNDSEDRVEVINALAKACKKQGSYQLACKKYLLIGERIK